MDKTSLKIFQKHSSTFFPASLFFPKKIQQDILTLYAFVRTVDNFVDQVPQKHQEFSDFKKNYSLALSSGKINHSIIYPFIKLVHRKKVDKSHVESFFHSMQMDFTKKSYGTPKELAEYMHGSAESIGLIMARILGLPTCSYTFAKTQGKAFQYINFIRDINEDLQLGRTYIPKEELAKHKLESLNLAYVSHHKENFKKFIREQIARYKIWQKEAGQGFRFIPKDYLIPIIKAVSSYQRTAELIRTNPFLVYQQKLAPEISE